MIFISHSSKDIEQVMQWCCFAESMGKECFVSERDLDKKKTSWRNELINAIEDCDKVLLVLTRNAIKSGEVENEISKASALRKIVIPLITEEFDIPDDFSYMINKYEWILAYQLEPETIRDILRNRILENDNEKREEFWNITQSKPFKKFSLEVMRKYYGEEFFMHINGNEFPVFAVQGTMFGDVASIKDFDSLCDFDNSDIADFDIEEHQNYSRNEYYAEYSRILEGKIRYPNRPGYMLDELDLNEDGLVDQIRVHVGTYAENVYSCHVLEYELYRAFMAFGNENLDNPEVWRKVKDFLIIRNRIHGKIGEKGAPNFYDRMYRSLLRGDGRDSLLSVQMLVIVRSKRTGKYEAKIIQRSKQVAVAPGIFQFIPSGGFEILNDSDDNIYDDIELEENFSPGCAVFREFLEELFNVPELEGGGTGSIEDRLLKDPRIVEIEEMLQDGRATLRFLGSVMDLVGLRHELSFVLVIHDPLFSQNRFIANEECKKGLVYDIPIDMFEKKVSIWKNIHGPSAAMWKFFKESELYWKLVK